MNYDYIIIGKSFSGITLGYLLKKNGNSVLLIQEQDKKDNLLGSFVTPKAYRLLSEIYTEETAESTVNKRHRNCHVILNKDIPVNRVELYSLDRDRLEEVMMKKYKEQGGECLSAIKGILVNFQNQSVYIGEEKIEYNYLIVADGSSSDIREQLIGKKQNVYTAIDSVYSVEMKDLIIEFKDTFKGVAWAIPSGNKTYVGLVDIGNINKINTRIAFEELLKKYNLFKGVVQELKIPTGDDILLKKDNVYLIGEAAGFVSPVTCESLYLDLFSAKMLERVLTNDDCNYFDLMSEEIKKIDKELEYAKTAFDSNYRNKAVSFMKSDNFITKKIREQAVKKAVEYISN